MKSRSYARFAVLPCFRQGLRSLWARPNFYHNAQFRMRLLRRDQDRIEAALNGEMRNWDVLIVGPGQNLTEANYFGVHNQITGIDLDVISQGFRPRDYVQMLRQNGIGCYRARYFRSKTQNQLGRFELANPSRPNASPKAGRDGRKVCASRSSSYLRATPASGERSSRRLPRPHRQPILPSMGRSS